MADYFVEIHHDTDSYNGHYDLTELEAWERYEREIIDAVEEVDTIVIGKDGNRIFEYTIDESTYDDYLDLVANKIATIDEQYKKVCDDHECIATLTIDTPIMCWNDGKDEKTLCRDCWEDRWWQTDKNEDNEIEIEEMKEFIKDFPRD